MKSKLTPQGSGEFNGRMGRSKNWPMSGMPHVARAVYKWKEGKKVGGIHYEARSRGRSSPRTPWLF